VVTFLALGGGLAFAAAIQPGPLQAFLLARATAAGWRRTLPACLAPLLSDGPIALVAVLVLGRLAPVVQVALRAAGGVFLVYLAIGAALQWRKADPRGAPASPPRTLVEAALVNLLNPNPYLAWALVIGPLVVEAWRDHPANGVALVLAFYATMVTTLAGFILLAGTSHLLGDRGRRALQGASAFILAGLGVYLIGNAVSAP
jgi:threonine/homoserine/homoserine lactone efflux protein